MSRLCFKALELKLVRFSFFFFQAEDGIRYDLVTGVQTCALPIYLFVHTSIMVPLGGIYFEIRVW